MLSSRGAVCASHIRQRLCFGRIRLPAGPASSRPGRAPGMASTSAAGAAGGEGGARAPLIDPIVQYVVLRKDLWTEKGWPLGSVVAQACHASSAAIWTHRDDAATLEYCCPERIDQMHKVVLEVKDEAQLRGLAAKLAEAGVSHTLWVEQPENYPTCLASKPYRKSDVAQHFKKFQLCKAALGGPSKS